MGIKTLRSLAIVASAALVLGAFVAPADAKKKKKVKKCAPYTTPEWAGEAETTVVTDAATADAPIELKISTAPGVGTSSEEPHGGTGASSYTYHNFVIDSAAPSASVSARVDSVPTWDYDLWWRYPEGPPAASAAGFWVIPGGEGGETGIGYEQVNAVPAADCQGFTAEIVGAVTPGGEVTLKVWLGK
ncbi:MAG TPA: hypothetical protein VG929_09495 [Actinomycetota bacterium]|nr:hypothetical protein [Actinomycetota bacterium]